MLCAQKRARWWSRLGGKPVVHAASPRFMSCLEAAKLLNIKFLSKAPEKIAVSENIVNHNFVSFEELITPITQY